MLCYFGFAAAGADVTIENRFGYTALTYAVQGEFWDIVNILEKSGESLSETVTTSELTAC